jgi:hypothetical protein
MVSSSLGYVVVPCCPKTFDGTNYADVPAHMRVHMRGLRLWGVLCGDVPCPPRPIALVGPVPLPPLVIVVDASEAYRVAAKTVDDAAVDAYDQQVVDFSEALSTYHDAQTAYTQWCDEDTRVAVVLTASVVPQFASDFMALATIYEMWDHLRQWYQPSGDSLYFSVVRLEHAL